MGGGGEGPGIFLSCHHGWADTSERKTITEDTVRPRPSSWLGHFSTSETQDVDDEENAVVGAAWLSNLLKSSQQEWNSRRSLRDEKRKQFATARLRDERLIYRQSLSEYHQRRATLGNEALELEKTAKNLILVFLGLENHPGLTDGGETDGRKALEAQWSDNVKARAMTASEMVRNERHQTANAVYLYRPLARGEELEDQAQASEMALQAERAKLQGELAELETQLGKEKKQVSAKIRELVEQQAQERTARTALLQTLEGEWQHSQEEVSDSRTPDPTERTYDWDVLALSSVMIVLGILLGVPAIKTVGIVNSETLSSSAALIVPVYCLLIIPIGLFLTHDVIDKRWRRVGTIKAFSWIYGILSFVGLALLTSYAFVQFMAGDVGEGMAAAVSCSVAMYGGYIHVRQRAILIFFSTTLKTAADKIRVHGVCRQAVDLENLPVSATTLCHCVSSLSPAQLEEFFPGGPCYDKLSSALLDDDYPGEGPRVTWLARRPRVIDKLEFTARVGLWILLASKPLGYSFSEEVQPKIDANIYLPANPLSKRALWTVDLARLMFLSMPKTQRPQDDEADHHTSPSDIGALVDGASTRGIDGVVKWVDILRRVPNNEWAQALSEYPSREVAELSEMSVSWEILLALSSLQTKTTHGDPAALRARVENLTRVFEDLGCVESSLLRSSTTTIKNHSPEDWLPFVESLTRQWPILLALLESSRAPGVADVQFEEQVKRSQDVDLMVIVALMLGVVPQWELEFECEVLLPMNNTTLLFQKREEHVLGVIRKYHLTRSS